MPTVCLIIAECSALNTCGIVACTALALKCRQCLEPAVASGCGTHRHRSLQVPSTLGVNCGFVCQALSHPCRQPLVSKVCLMPVWFGICSVPSACTGLLSAVCSAFWFLWYNQCSRQGSGTVAGGRCQCHRQCLLWMPTACSCCPHTPCLPPQKWVLAARPTASFQCLMLCLFAVCFVIATHGVLGTSSLMLLLFTEPDAQC